MLGTWALCWWWAQHHIWHPGLRPTLSIKFMKWDQRMTAICAELWWLLRTWRGSWERWLTGRVQEAVGDLLVCLVACAGLTVSRRDACVWPHAVTESICQSRHVNLSKKWHTIISEKHTIGLLVSIHSPPYEACFYHCRVCVDAQSKTGQKASILSMLSCFHYFVDDFEHILEIKEVELSTNSTLENSATSLKGWHILYCSVLTGSVAIYQGSDKTSLSLTFRIEKNVSL